MSVYQWNGRHKRNVPKILLHRRALHLKRYRLLLCRYTYRLRPPHDDEDNRDDEKRHESCSACAYGYNQRDRACGVAIAD